VRPRWPYDMRPSVRAEKYIRDASGAEKTWPMATITGRTDKQTDRQTECDAMCGPLLATVAVYLVLQFPIWPSKS